MSAANIVGVIYVALGVVLVVLHVYVTIMGMRVKPADPAGFKIGDVVSKLADKAPHLAGGFALSCSVRRS